jgi:hypothetical protein
LSDYYKLDVQSRSMGGGLLESGNVASHADITSNNFSSAPALATSSKPDDLPFNVEKPNGTVAMG